MSNQNHFCTLDSDCTKYYGSTYCCAMIDATQGELKESGRNCYHRPTIEKNNGKITIESVKYELRCVDATTLQT